MDFESWNFVLASYFMYTHKKHRPALAIVLSLCKCVSEDYLKLLCHIPVKIAAKITGISQVVRVFSPILRFFVVSF